MLWLDAHTRTDTHTHTHAFNVQVINDAMEGVVEGNRVCFGLIEFPLDPDSPGES